MKARSKPCRHCAYTKNHIGTAERIIELKGAINSGVIQSFTCHEHTEETLCHGFCKENPDRVPDGTVFSHQNGDKKATFAHLSREQLMACGNDYLGYGVKA